MFQLWAASKLGRLPFDLRKHVRFFAPLTESLDFMGIDPVTFARNSIAPRFGRDGLVHNIPVDCPRFDFNITATGDLPAGIFINAGSTLQFSSSNGLSDINTLIWFENDVAKSTPTDANPFTSSGIYSGVPDKYIKYLTKMDRILTAAEIATVQRALTDIPPIEFVIVPPVPPVEEVTDHAIFVKDVPTGRNGVQTVFTLSNDPILDSVMLVCFGIVCRRVASAPGNMEYTLSGAGNRNITIE